MNPFLWRYLFEEQAGSDVEVNFTVKKHTSKIFICEFLEPKTIPKKIDNLESWIYFYFASPLKLSLPSG